MDTVAAAKSGFREAFSLKNVFYFIAAMLIFNLILSLLVAYGGSIGARIAGIIQSPLSSVRNAGVTG